MVSSESEEDDDEGSIYAVPLLNVDVRESDDFPVLAVSIVAPTPIAPAPSAASSVLFLPGPFLFSPKLSTDLIVIKDGFVRLPKLAWRTSAGCSFTRPLRSSGSDGEIVPRSLVIVSSSSDSRSSSG